MSAAFLWMSIRPSTADSLGHSLKLTLNKVPADHVSANATKFTSLELYQKENQHSTDVDKLRRILKSLTNVLNNDEIFSLIYLTLLFGEDEAPLKRICTKMVAKKLNQIFKCNRGAEILDFIKEKIQEWIRTVPFILHMKEPDLGVVTNSELGHKLPLMN